MKCGTSNTQMQPYVFSIPADVQTQQTPGIKIMVQDRQPLFLVGLCEFLRKSGFTVTGEARDHITLMHAITNQGIPDIVLIDYKTETQDSFTMVKEFKGAYPTMKIILLIPNISNDSALIDYIKKIGINGIISKRHHSIQQVHQAIITVFNGGSSFDQI